MLTLLSHVDVAVRTWLTTHHAPWLDALMLTFSAVGRRSLVWLVLGGLLVIRRRTSAAGVWRLVLALCLATVVTDGLLKPLVARPRPFDGLDEVRVVGARPTTYAFPSGHATTAFAGAFALSQVWPSARVGLWMLATLIAFSRVYLGVHYPFDVVAGAVVGLGVAYFVLGGRDRRGPEPGAVKG